MAGYTRLVGIGTTSPGARLEVSGTTNLDGAVNATNSSNVIYANYAP
jgi:hypothetical protein